jgi:hypothetical protein
MCKHLCHSIRRHLLSFCHTILQNMNIHLTTILLMRPPDAQPTPFSDIQRLTAGMKNIQLAFWRFEVELLITLQGHNRIGKRADDRQLFHNTLVGLRARFDSFNQKPLLGIMGADLLPLHFSPSKRLPTDLIHSNHYIPKNFPLQLERLMLRPLHNLFLQRLAQITKIVAIPRHAHDQIPILIRVGLRGAQRGRVHHVELDVVPVQLKYVRTSCANLSSALSHNRS